MSDAKKMNELRDERANAEAMHWSEPLQRSLIKDGFKRGWNECQFIWENDKEIMSRFLHEQRISRLQIEIKALDEYFMDALMQGCGTYHPNTKEYSFDHMCLSTYEHMVSYALKKGWIQPHQVTR